MKDPRSLIKPGNEDSHQIALGAWRAKMLPRYPELELLHHIPNGGSRNKIEAGKLKAMMAKAGVSDLFWPIARRGYHGLYLELKHDATGLNEHVKARMVAENQLSWLDKVKEQGYCGGVAYGYDEAVKALCWYNSMEEL